MPRTVGVVQKPGLFEDILSRLGVNRPLQPFTLDGEIVPVILVDSGVSFVASPTPAYQITDIFTAGVQVAPPVNTVLADTGPLPVGAYTLQILMYCTEDGNDLLFQWRDAPNAANLFQQEIRFGANSMLTFFFQTRLEIKTVNERFRVLNRVVGGVGERFQASIFAKI